MEATKIDWTDDVAPITLKIRDLRQARGISQARLAELLEVSPVILSRWELGRSVPRVDAIVKIAELLDVSVDAILGRATTQAEPRLRNPKLHSLYKEVDHLSDDDQQALVVLLDSLVKRSQMNRLLSH
jgi:transcriptional regulator with XRE-family HTH domain